MDPITGIEVATQSARQLKEQRQRAAWVVLRHVLEALEEGNPIEKVIDATGFEWEPTYTYLSLGPRTRQDAFAQWLAREIETAIRYFDPAICHTT